SAVSHGNVRQVSVPAHPSGEPVEDEYVRYDLLDPATHSFQLTHDLSLVKAGATTYSDRVTVDTQMRDVSVIDVMTGAPLTFKLAAGRIDITLARPVPKGGQTRLRIVSTRGDGRVYRQLPPDIAFASPTPGRRGAVVLPKNFELIHTTLPMQVIQEPDGR